MKKMNPLQFKLMSLFLAFCCALLLIDFVHHRHSEVWFEAWPMFYALFGFISMTLLVLLAAYILRPIAMRDEEYYD